MAHHYQEFSWHFARLGRAYREGQLVFVLGAGVSRPYGHPVWFDLVTSLLLDSGRVPRLGRHPISLRGAKTAAATPDPETAAKQEREVVSKVFGHLVPDTLLQGQVAREAYPASRWNSAIEKHLGEGTVGRPDTTKEGILRHVGTMLVELIATNPKLHISVLSFNYDSLLDNVIVQELEHRGMQAAFRQSIRTEEDYERTWVDAGIYIYHLHGYLGDEFRDPVLDADSYVAVLGGNHWSWRCMDRVLTTTGTAALFIGLSLTDPSLRYILTRWKSWQSPMTGVYLAPPPKLPKVSGKQGRSFALMYLSIMDLYSTVLGRMHLACYYLSSWREIRSILGAIGGFDVN